MLTHLPAAEEAEYFLLGQIAQEVLLHGSIPWGLYDLGLDTLRSATQTRGSTAR